jgi:hypothetical protein
MIVEQIRLAKDDWRAHNAGNSPRPCTNSFTTSTGIPCAHRLYDRLERARPIQLKDIHRHWHIAGDSPLAGPLEHSTAVRGRQGNGRTSLLDDNLYDNELGEFESVLIAGSDCSIALTPCPPQALIGLPKHHSRKRSLPSGDSSRRVKQRGV